MATRESTERKRKKKGGGKKPPDSEKVVTPFGQTLRTGGRLPRIGPTGVLQPLGEQFGVLPQQKELTQHHKRLKHTGVILISIKY